MMPTGDLGRNALDVSPGGGVRPAPMFRAIAIVLALSGCSELREFVIRCDRDEECDKGRICLDGECVRECFLDSDCDEGSTCAFNRCRVPAQTPDASVEADVSASDASATDAAAQD